MKTRNHSRWFMSILGKSFLNDSKNLSFETGMSSIKASLVVPNFFASWIDIPELGKSGICSKISYLSFLKIIADGILFSLFYVNHSKKMEKSQ